MVRALTGDPPKSVVGWLDSVWTPAHGAFLFILVFTLSCLRRIVGVARRSPPAVSVDSPAGASARSAVGRVLRQLSSFRWRRSGGDSPMSNDRTRELASMPFEDGKSRRRGVKAGEGTKGGGGSLLPSGSSASSHANGGDIEMQSLTASLADLHIPKMIYLPSHGGGGSDDSGVSPMAASCLLTPQRLQMLLPYLPASSHVQDLALQYSLSVCGASLTDLYRRSKSSQDAITVIQDSAGYIFGCFTSQPWKVHDTYYGAADALVFTLHPQFHVYPVSNANQFFQLASRDSLAIGGGDHFALWLDDSFRKGQSKPCQTFGSPCLSSEEEFRCHELEVWSFVDAYDQW